MKDYQGISVCEAAQREITEELVNAIKGMDTNKAISRVDALWNHFGHEIPFWKLASSFIAVANVKTSVDGY